MPKQSLWVKTKRWGQQETRVLITSAAVTGFIVLMRLTGLLQSFEWAALDQLFRLRPNERPDQRITIVEINEKDLQRLRQWPMSDAVLAKLLQKLNTLQPRAIGLDLYRNFTVKPGHQEFVAAVKKIPNLVAIELLQDQKSLGVPPPPVLSSDPERVGFNNVVVDADGKVRRSVLYWHVDGKLHTSFALQLAFLYLNTNGINPEQAAVNSEYLQLGKTVFKSLEPNDGGYVRTDAHGYQILTNFRRPANFRVISLTDVLEDRVEAEWIKDRIVLIGSTAPSLQDFFYYPYSGGFIDSAVPISGVEVHAHFISQILGAVLDGRSLINVWPDPVEYLWIFGWSWLGAFLCWRLRSPQKSAFSIFGAGIGLAGSAYFIFLNGWWIPIVPPMLALAGSAVVITGYIAQLEEELKRSKDFLQKVINTIADPIFVKDKYHQSIILNQAYCRLIGYPLDNLLGKADYDIFPQDEAKIFWQHNDQVLTKGEEQENEEELTDSRGNKHLIATKRSLHKDAAGNLFLVGVIRDITERKRMEEVLKLKTQELLRSNTELKLSEESLLYLANHDNLTGLPNRKQFYERFSQCIQTARSKSQLVALLFIDLDGFKQVNDTLGHDTGDLLLKVVAQRLTRCLRGSDTVSRLAGDEFTVILPGIPKPQDATRVAEKIISTLAEVFILEEKEVFITASIGISIYPLDGEEMDILIKKADEAMYRAKESGRNQFYIYNT